MKKYQSLLALSVFFVCLTATLLGSGCALFSTFPRPENSFTLTVSPENLTLGVGESAPLTANTEDKVFWLSEDERVATVDENGLVTGVAIGETFVIAVFQNAQAECLVTVTGEVSLSLLFDEALLAVGHTVNLKPTTTLNAQVQWSSSAPEIATVSAGAVLGMSEGDAVITAKAGESFATCTVHVSADSGVEKAMRGGFALVWQDEFDGQTLDADKWSFQYGAQDVYGNSKGPENWGNNELQYYREENLTVSDGALCITARREQETVGGKSYTSSRITTRDKFYRQYGYFEARMKLPVADGMWPAFWMQSQPSSPNSSHNEYGGWPRKGEIDIMESRGRVPDVIGNALHFGDYSPKNAYKNARITLSSPIDEWHTYAVDWRKDYIAWLVDGREVFRVTNEEWWTAAVDKEENPYAPFDKPFFLLLNLAVGGNYDPEGTQNLKNNPDFTEANMYVDYVRVYVPEN